MAVEQGRVIFDNVRKFVFYLFSCNIAEVGTVFAASMAGLPLPLQPLQILWLNLITDVFPALALAMEPAEPGVMSRPPRDPQAALPSRRMLTTIGLYGAFLTVTVLVVFVWALGSGSTERANTLAFLTLAFAQAFHALNARTEGPLRLTHLPANLWMWSAIVLVVGLMIAAVQQDALAGLLHTVPVRAADWGIVFFASLLPLATGQLWKRRPRRSRTVRSPASGDT